MPITAASRAPREEFSGSPAPPAREPDPPSAALDTSLGVAALGPQQEILACFKPQERLRILERLNLLSTTAFFIGKDFQIPIKLNRPGGGWHWDPQTNEILVDPQDLASEPFFKLRSITAHEGAHRRISRIEAIPPNLRRTLGFFSLANALEDPRVNNFLINAYPALREDMVRTHQLDFALESELTKKSRAALGFMPDHVRAGLEYIRRWHYETSGQPAPPRPDLPQHIQDVVEKTLAAARRAWNLYPSKEEADRSSALVDAYALASHRVIRDQIWPEFKKLIDKDVETQTLRELVEELKKHRAAAQSGKGAQSQTGPRASSEPEKPVGARERGEGLLDKLKNIGQKLMDKFGMARDPQKRLASMLGEKKAEELMQALSASAQNTAAESAARAQQEPISQEAKGALLKLLRSLPRAQKKELEQKAQEALGKLEEAIRRELSGKLGEDRRPRRSPPSAAKGAPFPLRYRAERPAPIAEKKSAADSPADGSGAIRVDYRAAPGKSSAKLEDPHFHGDSRTYQAKRKEVIRILNRLEDNLRDIFRKRRASSWSVGRRSGPSIDVERRIGEIAKDVSALKTRAFRQRQLPVEKDYAATLLVDLSGSMKGAKIRETLKGVIILAEVLHRLSIRFEVLGFNNHIFAFKKFHEKMSPEIRRKMAGMLEEVESERARWNDDGWALEQAALRLARQKPSEKFLIVLSDGRPEPSDEHAGKVYELSQVIAKIRKGNTLKLIGLGLGSATDYMERYYPNCLANISAADLAEKLAAFIQNMIEKQDHFKR